jgi:16S rRNA (cytidine1402-2'-O)-methyltransferase
MTLYLLPNVLDENAEHKEYLPGSIATIIENLEGIIAENEQSARRYLSHYMTHEKALKIPCSVFTGKTDPKDIDFHLEPLKKGENWGYLAEAGLPCIADPGAPLVFRANKLGIKVKACSGPSAIFQAIMLSGLSGQHFTFHGYLDRKEDVRLLQIKEMQKAVKKGYTQIFIEAPHKAEYLLPWLIENLSEEIYLSLAINLSTSKEKVHTYSVKTWKTFPLPNLKKQRVTYLIG